MSQAIEISVILTTYQRPRNLARSLASLAVQRGVDGRFEVIVADDGSLDETPNVVREFSRKAHFPICFTTHPHDGFRAAKVRNNGVRASSAEYLIFADGDCILPPDHLWAHLLARRRGIAIAGGAYRLDRETSERIDDTSISSGVYQQWITPDMRRRMRGRWLKDSLYHLIRHPIKPKLDSCDCGIWRKDFEAVNGFDEDYCGWGCEDDDLGRRLLRRGVRIVSNVRRTCVYHLWHPREASCPVEWKTGSNIGRLLREKRPIRCVNGLAPLRSHAA